MSDSLVVPQCIVSLRCIVIHLSLLGALRGLRSQLLVKLLHLLFTMGRGHLGVIRISMGHFRLLKGVQLTSIAMRVIFIGSVLWRRHIPNSKLAELRLQWLLHALLDLLVDKLEILAEDS